MAHRHRHPEDHLFFLRLVSLFHVTEDTRPRSLSGASSSSAKPTVASPTAEIPGATKSSTSLETWRRAGDVVGVVGDHSGGGMSASNGALAGDAEEETEVRRKDGREGCDGADVRIFQILTR